MDDERFCERVGDVLAVIAGILLAILVGFVGRAHAVPGEFCDLDLAPGTDCYACAGNLITLETERYSGLACRCPAESLTGGGGCYAGTNEYGLVSWLSDFQDGDGIFSINQWVPITSADIYGPSAGGGGSGGSFDINDIDLAAAGGFFSVGFTLVFMFWGLGKGVSLILDVLRRSN